MRKLFIIIFFISLSSAIFPQSDNKVHENLHNNFITNNYKQPSTPKVFDHPFFSPLGLAALLINPILVYENKKVEFGLTKEVSLLIYPIGRFSFEYSRIFRGFSQNLLRISYNYDIFKVREFIAYGFSPGAGYYSDTKLNGYFFQISYGIMIPIEEKLSLAMHPYVKLRYTVVPQETVHNSADLSVGLGIYFFTGFH